MSLKTKKLLKILALLLLAGILIGGFIGYKMYNKPHRRVDDANSVKIEALQLVTEYETNEAEANKKYLDKVLNVSGKVTEVGKNQDGNHVVTLGGSNMGAVICTVEDKAATPPATGHAVNIKGICTGYLTDVVLARAVLEKK